MGVSGDLTVESTSPPGPKAFLLPALLITLLCGYEFLDDALQNLRYYGWGDFRGFYAAAHVLAEDGDIYDAETQQAAWLRVGDQKLSDTSNLNVYPPLYPLVLRPLTVLPFGEASVGWGLLNILLWALSIWAVLLLLDLKPNTPAFWLIIVIALRFEPVLTHLKYGQFNLLPFLPVLGSLLALRARRPTLGAALLSFGILLKLKPAILVLFYAASRQYRYLLYVGVWLTGLTAMTILLVGWDNHVSFVTTVLPYLGEGYSDSLNQSITGFLWRLHVALGCDNELWLIVLSRVCTVVLCIWTYTRLARGSSPLNLTGVSTVLLLGSIVSPVTWTHHLVSAILPVGLIIRDWDTDATWQKQSPLIASLLILCVVDDYYVHQIFQSGIFFIFSSVKLLSVIYLYQHLLRRIPDEDPRGDVSSTS